MKGKNYSMNNTGQRKKNDFYETCYSLTWQLIETGEINDCGTILEPAAGNNAIVNQLNRWYVTNYDLFKDGTNFLHEDRQFDCVLTNPPYSKYMEFVGKAKTVATKKIIMLLPLSYLHGQKRYEQIYSDKEFPLKSVYVFTRYPLLGEPLREDGKYNTGMQVYGWYVWDKSYIGEPVIRWIDNNKYVLKKGK